MSDAAPLLCIGGPCAGQRYPADAGRPDLRVLLPRKPIDISAELSPVGGTVEYANYRRQIFCTPQGNLSVWAPTDQTPLNTLILLSMVYEKSLA